MRPTIILGVAKPHLTRRFRASPIRSREPALSVLIHSRRLTEPRIGIRSAIMLRGLRDDTRSSLAAISTLSQSRQDLSLISRRYSILANNHAALSLAAVRDRPLRLSRPTASDFRACLFRGLANPNSAIKNKPIAFFGQDTWKINRHLTINYGVRYDYEFTQQFAPTPFTDPLTHITLSAADVQTAQDALGITQGFPRDKNNWAPRLGVAWDVSGNGKTVIRAAAGIFYDHPLLAVAFNSDIADGSQQQQATLLPIGGPSPTGLLNAFQVFQGTVCGVQGSNAAVCGAAVTQAIASSAQYLFGFQRFNPSTFTGFGPILPFTLHVAKDFQYPEAMQGNLTVERMIGKNMALSVGFITVNAHHLAHPEDVNNVNLTALVDNFRRFTANNPVAPRTVLARRRTPPTSLSEARSSHAARRRQVPAFTPSWFQDLSRSTIRPAKRSSARSQPIISANLGPTTFLLRP